MRKTLIVIILTLLIFIIPVNKIKADMFDKPTAEVEVLGLKENYYFEILTYQDKEIKLLEEEDVLDNIERNYYQDDYPIDIFNGYQDSDNYVSRTLYTGIPAIIKKEGKDNFKIGYFSAPTKFKIAIVLEDDTLLVSNIINRRLFFSKMTFDLSEVALSYSQENIGTLKEDIPYFTMVWKFIVRVILTVAIELLILMSFKYRKKKSFLIVGVVNVITQSILTVFMMLSFYFWAAFIGLFVTVILGELLVFATEMITYRFTLKEQSSNKALLYGFVANLATFLLTFLTIWFI